MSPTGHHRSDGTGLPRPGSTRLCIFHLPVSGMACWPGGDPSASLWDKLAALGNTFTDRCRGSGAAARAAQRPAASRETLRSTRPPPRPGPPKSATPHDVLRQKHSSPENQDRNLRNEDTVYCCFGLLGWEVTGHPATITNVFFF